MSKIKGLRIYDDIVFSEEVQKYMYNLVKELPDWKKSENSQRNYSLWL